MSDGSVRSSRSRYAAISSRRVRFSMKYSSTSSRPVFGEGITPDGTGALLVSGSGVHERSRGDRLHHQSMYSADQVGSQRLRGQEGPDEKAGMPQWRSALACEGRALSRPRPVRDSLVSTTSLESAAPSAPSRDRTTSSATIVPVLAAISLCHLLNDLMQSLLPAAFPVLHRDFSLSFGQIGLLSLVYQITASILQPLVGLYTDHRPKPYSLPFAMLASMTGLLTLAFGPDYHTLLAGAALLGLGSSIFHPESSRIARLAS